MHYLKYFYSCYRIKGYLIPILSSSRVSREVPRGIFQRGTNYCCDSGVRGSICITGFYTVLSCRFANLVSGDPVSFTIKILFVNVEMAFFLHTKSKEQSTEIKHFLLKTINCLKWQIQSRHWMSMKRSFQCTCLAL